MTLTAKQEAFAQAIASGMNHSDAYRQAGYGGDSSPATINDHAYDLAHHAEVVPRVLEIQSIAARRKSWSLDRIIERAEQNLDIAQGEKQIAAANGALAYIGKATGLVVDKSEHVRDINVRHIQELDTNALIEAMVEIARLKALPQPVIIDQDVGENSSTPGA